MRFASLDVYPKTLQEFHEKTKLGAILSLVCGAVIALLICVEVSDFLQVARAAQARLAAPASTRAPPLHRR